MRGALVPLVLAGAIVTAGCSSSTDGGGGGAAPATSAPAPGGATTGTLPDGRCAWAVKADKATLNIAFPDTGATYWALSYSLAPGETLRLHGRYPEARYFSFITYGANGGAIDTLTDRDVVPDAGNTNPFGPPSPSDPADAPATTAPPAPGASAGGTYTVTIRGDLGTGTPANTLGATSATPPTSVTTTAGATTPPGSTAEVAEAIRLGSGGADGVRGSVIYRVYVPDEPGDAKGGAGLPDVTVVAGDGTETAVPTCPKPGPSEAAKAIVDAYERPATAPPPTPIFIRPQGNQANLYPNPDNVYVATLTTYEPGRVAVVRGKAPTFPDTRAGAPITGDEQVRYWSMCTNEFRTPYPVTACAADFQTTLDEDGWYTYVISTPEDRPAETEATKGSTWLDWGATDVANLLLLRNMLADPDFPEAATNLAPGTLASPTMGDYAPKGAYCTKATFEQGGAAACGL